MQHLMLVSSKLGAQRPCASEDGKMNFLDYKWYPCASYWEDKPAHKAEVFRTKDKNLHWSLDWTLEHCTKSECIKKILLLPYYPRNITTNSWFTIFSVVYRKYSVKGKSQSFNVPDFIYWPLCLSTRNWAWPWPSTREEFSDNLSSCEVGLIF